MKRVLAVLACICMLPPIVLPQAADVPTTSSAPNAIAVPLFWNWAPAVPTSCAGTGLLALSFRVPIVTTVGT